MIRNIIIAILIIIIILLLAYYYQASSLKLEHKGVMVKVKSKHLFFDANIIQTKPITFFNVNIMQTKLSDGTYFEVATCEDSFEFNQNIKELIMTLFEAKKVEEVFSIRGVRAMRVTLQNLQVINLFVEDSNLKELKLFYGIAYDKFYRAIQNIMGDQFRQVTIGGILELPKPMTQWSLINNNEGLISPIEH